MSGSLPRIAILVSAALLLAAVAATITFAAGGETAPVLPAVVPVVQPKPELVVPDVRGQAYVFAKGTLEDAGFAWQVRGGVEGFAANQVTTQQPAPGTRVLDTGTPLVTLSLARNARYKQEGAADNASKYRGTAVVLAAAAAVHATKPAAKPKPAAPAKPATPSKTAKAAAPKKAQLPQKRPPAFVVAGAPAEPLDEMPLTDRVTSLAKWVEKHPHVTPANVDHWLYQHSWIVTGARMGWWHGAEALRELVKVDQRAQKLWGFGARSEQLARAALAEVEARGA